MRQVLEGELLTSSSPESCHVVNILLYPPACRPPARIPCLANDIRAVPLKAPTTLATAFWQYSICMPLEGRS